MRKVILAALLVSLCGCSSFNKPKVLTPTQAADPVALRDDHARPSLGWLEHRGHRHALRDLADPAYRAASDDPFARDFEPDRALAIQWAGM